MTIKLQELERLIEVTLFTGYIKDEKPVSLLIIADDALVQIDE